MTKAILDLQVKVKDQSEKSVFLSNLDRLKTVSMDQVGTGKIRPGTYVSVPSLIPVACQTHRTKAGSPWAGPLLLATYCIY